MKGERYLLKLLEQGYSWQSQMPRFKEDKIELSLPEKELFQGQFPIVIDDDGFSCYVESLKNIVKPVSPWYEGSNPIIFYRILTEELVKGYQYEDELTIVYSDGTMKIHFDIRVEDEASIIKLHEEMNDDFIQVQLEEAKYSNETIAQPIEKIKKARKKTGIHFEFSKMTYSPDDILKLNIYNEDKISRSIEIITDHPMITPANVEFYIKEDWLQEWYIKKSTFTRMLQGVFNASPFTLVNFNVVLDGAEQKEGIQCSLTTFENYHTVYNVESLKDYKFVRLSCIQAFMHGRVSREVIMKIGELYERIRGCLNYNQDDILLRVLYIWLLIDEHNLRAAKQEYQIINRNGDFFENHPIHQINDILKYFVEGKKRKSQDYLDGVGDKDYWVVQLIKASYIINPREQFNIYENLYNKGFRHTLIFVESLRVANENMSIIDIDSPFFMAIIQWGLAKKFVSPEWIHRLDQRYYTLERSGYCDSAMVYHFYKQYMSQNFLKVFCIKAIQEERTDRIAFEFYKKAIQMHMHINDLEVFYIKTSYMLDKTIDFKPMINSRRFGELGEELKTYVFYQLISQKDNNMDLYKRYADEIHKHLIEIISDNHINETSLLLIEKYVMTESAMKFDIYDQLSHKQVFDLVIRYENGLVLLKGLLKTLMDKCYKSTMASDEKYRKLFRRFLIHLGYEKILLLLPEMKGLMEEHYDMTRQSLEDGRYLSNKGYRRYLYKQPLIEKLIISLIHNASVAKVQYLYDNLSRADKSFVIRYVGDYLTMKIISDSEILSYGHFNILKECIQSESYRNQNHIFAAIRLAETLELEQDQYIKDLIWRSQQGDFVHKEILSANQYISYRTIEFLAIPEAEVYLHYRYIEEENYTRVKMKHIVMGLFNYHLKIFDGDIIDYYISVDYDPVRKQEKKKLSRGNRQLLANQFLKNDIPVSDRMVIDTVLDADRNQVEEIIESLNYALASGDRQGFIELLDEWNTMKRKLERII